MPRARKKNVDPETMGKAAKLEEEASARILNSMIEDAKNARFPRTYAGIISDVREGPTYKEDGGRIFVIKVLAGYVYMLEQEAPDDMQKLPPEQLIGREITFKPISANGTYISVSNKFCSDMYRLAMQNKTSLEGTITAVYPDKENIDNAYVLVSHRGDRLVMPMKEVSVFGIPTYEASMLNRKTTFRVINVDDDGTVYVSHAVIEAEQRDAVINELQKHPEGVTAVITRIRKFGAYLAYRGVPLILRNKDFSLDYTNVGDVKQKNDMLVVRLKEISKTRRIFVEMVDKYQTPTELAKKSFVQGQIVVGIVRSLSETAVFVRVAPGIDAMCFNSDSLTRQPVKGDRVSVKIRSVREEKDHGRTVERVRGYIVGYIETRKDNHLGLIPQNSQTPNQFIDFRTRLEAFQKQAEEDGLTSEAPEASEVPVNEDADEEIDNAEAEEQDEEEIPAEPSADDIIDLSGNSQEE